MSMNNKIRKGSCVRVIDGAGHGAPKNAAFRVTAVYGLVAHLTSLFTITPQNYGLVALDRLKLIHNNVIVYK